ncbi:MAG TPA: magnesium transporter, partial [Nitrosomonas sp.]|nr:magnesium transporter [Nitrosomonas sp.]
MIEDSPSHDAENAPTPLEQTTYLLRKYKLVEGLVNLQEANDQSLTESSVQTRNLSELQHFLEQLHPADIAHILEALPLDDRLLIWSMVKAEQDGEVLLETSDAVRATLITDMGSQELIAATEYLDTDEIADLAPDLPQDVMDDVFRSLPITEREQ